MEAARITTITMEIVFLFLSFILSPLIIRSDYPSGPRTPRAGFRQAKMLQSTILLYSREISKQDSGPAGISLPAQTRIRISRPEGSYW